MKRGTIALLAVLALFLLAVGVVAVAEVTGYLPGPMQGMHSRAHMSGHHSSMWGSHHTATMPHGDHQQMNGPQHHAAGMTDDATMHPSHVHATTCVTNAS